LCIFIYTQDFGDRTTGLIQEFEHLALNLQ